MERLWKIIPGTILVALVFFVTILGNVTSALADDMGPLSLDVFIQGRGLAVTTVSDPQECSYLCESDDMCLAINWSRRTSTCTELIAYFSVEVNPDYISALKPQGYQY